MGTEIHGPCTCASRRVTISQSDQVAITRCARCSAIWINTGAEERPATGAETAIVEIVESLIRLKLPTALTVSK